MQTENAVPEWMLAKTFAIQHSPNCPKPFLVRFCGAAVIDFKAREESNDIIGAGNTLTEAIEDAARNLGLRDLKGIPRGPMIKRV